MKICPTCGRRFNNRKEPLKHRKAIPPNARFYIMKYYKGKCFKCGDPAHHIHHKDNDPSNNMLDNLIPLCVICHALEHPTVGFVLTSRKMDIHTDFSPK